MTLEQTADQVVTMIVAHLEACTLALAVLIVGDSWIPRDANSGASASRLTV